jgi:hypothetical protein
MQVSHFDGGNPMDKQDLEDVLVCFEEVEGWAIQTLQGR